MLFGILTFGFIIIALLPYLYNFSAKGKVVLVLEI